jgi:hypothetical protein
MKRELSAKHRKTQSKVHSHARPNWASFFALEIDMPDDFLTDRDDRAPQPRRAL